MYGLSGLCCLSDNKERPAVKSAAGLLYNMRVNQRRHKDHLCGICAVLCIGFGQIDTGLLSLAVFEEVDCYLREQSIGQNVLILLLPLGNFLLKLGKLGLDQICGTAGDRLLVADDLLADLFLDGKGGASIVAAYQILGLCVPDPWSVRRRLCSALPSGRS